MTFTPNPEYAKLKQAEAYERGEARDYETALRCLQLAVEHHKQPPSQPAAAPRTVTDTAEHFWLWVIGDSEYEWAPYPRPDGAPGGEQ